MDCLGFVCGIWCEFYGFEFEWMLVYILDWGEIGDDELLMVGVVCLLLLVIEDVLGVVLIFWMWFDVIVKYMGILVEIGLELCFIYVYDRYGVVESLFLVFWWGCIVGWFSFLLLD